MSASTTVRGAGQSEGIEDLQNAAIIKDIQTTHELQFVHSLDIQVRFVSNCEERGTPSEGVEDLQAAVAPEGGGDGVHHIP